MNVYRRDDNMDLLNAVRDGQGTGPQKAPSC